MKRFLALLAAALLAGCASQPAATGNVNTSATVSSAPAPAPIDPAADLQKFTLADLATAEQDAKDSGDLIAQPCYPAIAQVIESLPKLGAQPSQTVGAATLFQRGRDFVNPIRGGIPTGLILGCGPLASQVRMDVLQLLAKIAGGAAAATVTGGITLTPLLVQ